MKAILAAFVTAVVLLRLFAADVPLEPRMSLEERAAKSELMLIGKFGPPGNTGKHTTTSLRVEEVLLGVIPTNKTLFVSYSGTRWLIPEIASRTHQPKPGMRWVFFLTTEGVKQSPGTNYFTAAVGPHKYAHDGFEFATDEVVKRVRELVSQKKERR